MEYIVVEKQVGEGIKRIAKRFSLDFELVYGNAPEIKEVSDIDDNNGLSERFIFICIDNSEIIEKIKQDYNIEIIGKRECYQIIKDGKDIYVIGSDKRGSIYGIFDLSEQIGVTPFVYWGDDIPSHRDFFDADQIVEKVSKEPSVEYRGFFINDEWPCFGNWTFSHYGGFTASMYEQVFEFLLRLKGNCLWPAMWSSSFSLDGPGQLNEELADIYGVIIEYSHHEPCLRASEEWDIYKGDDSDYGTEWNYVTNKEGLHNYWKDGLIRSGKYENIITMGMRGERDSKMQGTTSLQECIDLWKEIIASQDRLIDDYVENADKHPRLVAIYKEVEDYFFGDENTEGLSNWQGLEDKILMFCEDNYGYMRRLPDDNIRNHKGGLGMYFHLDYHGEPVSYEWINTTPLYKIWEQMSVAYNSGVIKMWMVNVGDLKGNEYPLSYFMNMAYDYERWGDSNTYSYTEYAKLFAKSVFGNEGIAEVLTDGIDIISCRRPEALSINTYSLIHGEIDYIIDKCNSIVSRLQDLKGTICDNKKDAYFSMVEYPIEIGINHILLHLFAKKNEHYAHQGKIAANTYADLMKKCYEKEDGLKREFSNFRESKWKGMELASHTGFTKWNDYGRRNPFICTVVPLEESHMLVSRIDDDYVACKKYGDLERIIIEDYSYKTEKMAALEIAVDGTKPLLCSVECEDKNVSVSWTEKEITSQELLLISIHEKFIGPAEIKISGGDTTVLVELRDAKEYVIIDALKDLSNSSDCILLPKYGKHGNGIKLTNDSKALYEFESNKNYTGEIELCLAPTNPNYAGGNLSLCMNFNTQVNNIDILSSNYKAGDPACEQWAEGVLCNERRVVTVCEVQNGKNTIQITGISPGIILEKILIHEKGMPSTYTGI